MTETPRDMDSSWPQRLLAVMRIVVGVLFAQYGAQKLWGFAGGRINHDFLTLLGIAGPLELLGGLLLALGLFTRPTAFILCGEMAVAYFMAWAPRGFWPITNGGEITVVFCYAFLYFVAAGAGPGSVDQLIADRRNNTGRMKRILVSWESPCRSIMRIVLSFTFSLHGYRHLL